MAKRKEVILQETLNTPTAWDEAMTKEKLYVVDVHQKWCGPCKAITGMLKRIKNELGDDLLLFATAEADSIPALESYRGRCEPVFLFFGCGQLVAYVRGCNAPLLQKTITETLETEHKVLEGNAERKVIKDLHETEIDEEEKEEADNEEEGHEVTVRKQVTVALIKPDVVANGQVEEILEKIKQAGIEILNNKEIMMTEDEAKAFYQNKAEEEYFDELITYVTSGPCQVLVLTKSGTGEGVVEMWRDIIGPFDAAVAKESSPESLRAIYGTDAKANALHGSSSQEEAARELGFFFPDYEPPLYRGPSAAPSGRSRASARSKKSARQGKQIQRTLAIVRPDALKTHKDAILEKIKEAGFAISMLKEMQLTEEQAKAFYKDHADKDYFEPLVKQMTSGPVMALCLAHTDAVQKWRGMLGPKIPEEAIEKEPDSLRAQFHVEEAPVNMLHGSDSPQTAEEELKNIFNIEQTLAVIKPDAIDQKDLIIEKLKEAGFMISCQKDMNLSKEIASEIYKSKEGAEFYDSLIDHMTSGPTLMMVLSAEDAVTKLRSIMGPADPDQAKESAPDSLRALFAKSITENAIHSPSNPESAKEKIKVVFGDVEFNWDVGAEEAEVSPEENEAEKADDQTEKETAEGEENTKESTGGEESAAESSSSSDMSEKGTEPGDHEKNQGDGGDSPAPNSEIQSQSEVQSNQLSQGGEDEPGDKGNGAEGQNVSDDATVNTVGAEGEHSSDEKSGDAGSRPASGKESHEKQEGGSTHSRTSSSSSASSKSSKSSVDKKEDDGDQPENTEVVQNADNDKNDVQNE